MSAGDSGRAAASRRRSRAGRPGTACIPWSSPPQSWRTAKMEPARVIVPGLVIFGLDAIQGTFYTEVAVDHLGIGSVIGAVLFGASALGLTFYAGMLERLVGSVERNEAAQPVFTVLRTLPWGRLLLAEAILIVVGAVASVALVVPGPDRGDGVRPGRSPHQPARLLGARCVQAITAAGVAAFHAGLRSSSPCRWRVEHEVVVFVAELVPHEHIWAVFLTTFILGDLFGMALGLMEVTLAERLVTGAQGPGHDLLSADVELAPPPKLPNPGHPSTT